MGLFLELLASLGSYSVHFLAILVNKLDQRVWSSSGELPRASLAFSLDNLHTLKMSHCSSCCHIFWGCISKKVKTYESNISIFNRFVQGLGMAAANTCLTAILMMVHHNHKGSIASFTETCDGMGYMIGCVWEMSSICYHTPIHIYLGPILGSYLYECGGFALPFHVTGVLIIVFTIFLCIVIPSGPRNKRDQRIKEETKTFTVWEIMKVQWKH